MMKGLAVCVHNL